MFIEDPKIQKMIIRKDLSKDRVTTYKIVLNEFCNLTNKTPTQLIEEAKKEEKPYLKENEIIFKEIDDRKISDYFYKYYAFLKEKKLSPSSIDTKIRTLRAFYNEYDIQLPKNIKISIPKKLIREGDNPTIDDIRKAVEYSSTVRNKAILTLMSSSGVRSTDLRNFKVKDFLIATKRYHDGTIEDLFQVEENMIPIWEFIPSKTRKSGNICITFNTPECSKFIVEYLKQRDNLKVEDYLFTSWNNRKMTRYLLIDMFETINDKYFGRTSEGKRFFHAHSLRKFFLSTFRQHTRDPINLAIVAGHKLPSEVSKSYQEIKINPIEKEYLKSVPHLSIEKIEINKIDDETTKKLKKENKEIKQAFDDYKQEQEQKNKEMIKSLKEEIKEDIKKEMS